MGESETLVYTRLKSKTRALVRGFSVVELLIVLMIVGILSTVSLYGLQKYVARSKATEATTALGGIRRGVLAHAEKDRMRADVLDLGDVSAEEAGGPLCGTATDVPTNFASVRGRKYQPKNGAGSDYETGDAATGWVCLRYRNDQPQFYQYGYKLGPPPVLPADWGVPGGVAPSETWTAYAHGDLDADGQASWHVLTGVWMAGQIVSGTRIGVIDEGE